MDKKLISEVLEESRGRYFPSVVGSMLLGMLEEELNASAGYIGVKAVEIEPLRDYVGELFGLTTVEQIFHGDSFRKIVEMSRSLDLSDLVYIAAKICSQSSAGSLAKSVKAEALGSYDQILFTMTSISIAHLEDTAEENSILSSQWSIEDRTEYLCTHVLEIMSALDSCGVEWKSRSNLLRRLEAGVEDG